MSSWGQGLPGKMEVDWGPEAGPVPTHKDQACLAWGLQDAAG